MSPSEPLVVEVRGGRIVPSGSWLYVWVAVDPPAVAYLGGTGFAPELRAHLHLTADDPAVGVVRATVPGAESGDFDILAFELPRDADRPTAKLALAAALADAGLFGQRVERAEADALAQLTVPIVVAIEHHLAVLRDRA